MFNYVHDLIDHSKSIKKKYKFPNNKTRETIFLACSCHVEFENESMQMIVIVSLVISHIKKVTESKVILKYTCM